MVISNPTKKIIVDFPISQVCVIFNKISAVSNRKFTPQKFDNTLKLYTFGSTEFLSIGVWIDINLTEVSETKTEIFIEVRRKVGAFDQTYEITHANQHIQDMFTNISFLLKNQNWEPKVVLINQQKNSNGTAFILLAVIIVVGIIIALALFDKPYSKSVLAAPDSTINKVSADTTIPSGHHRKHKIKK